MHGSEGGEVTLPDPYSHMEFFSYQQRIDPASGTGCGRKPWTQMSRNLFAGRAVWRRRMVDPIVDEVRRARAEHAKQFNFDIHAICEDLRLIESSG